VSPATPIQSAISCAAVWDVRAGRRWGPGGVSRELASRAARGFAGHADSVGDFVRGGVGRARGQEMGAGRSQP
ncbi:hypothetical protein ACFWF7_38260, partial [Nocardia sp. NPDC060256]|uniref:hypothetical protein n=1 Tax=Nocardia sp. NPDC060256 TaxID=3347086 RepID=UPI00364B90A5